MDSATLRQAIITEDVHAFKQVKGVGPKTAKRLIVELKDVMMKESGSESVLISTPVDNTKKQEALSALIALGFNKSKVEKIVSQSLMKDPSRTVEELIKDALKQFS